MAEHAERSERNRRAADTSDGSDPDATRALPPVDAAGYGNHAAPDETEETPARRRVDWLAVKDRIVGLLAGIVRWVGLAFAAILVLHVVFVVGDANPDNGIVSFVRDWSDSLALGFKDLFTPDDAKLRVLVNYGIAAIFWLIVSSVLARIIRRIGGTSL
ncbi:hypothetical protein SAMN05421810_10341 [Amycolatopsis arida]|uniref:YGGT family protein n=1 Tax=Amycolatopsis arida TaxID=587909 RepID=A0A1I5S806_9PSEU|nr:hypothetical protein CLV69_11641 [Amycolatopsis arida]SFP66855.1 hypothetical protein SAMN05421810_10341 [Amycolatopsis arida]